MDDKELINHFRLTPFAPGDKLSERDALSIRAAKGRIERHIAAAEKGGRVVSERKLEAVRANGRRGGRPPADNPTPAAIAKRKSRAKLKT